VFSQLRDLAIQQGFKPNADGEGSARGFKLQFAIQDVHMCRGAFARLHLMGVSPRLTSLLKNVMQGKRVPDVDVRYLKKKKGKQLSNKSGEVFSYLQSLYESVAESLPENDNTREDFDDSDKEEIKQSNEIILLHGKPDSSDPLTTQQDNVRYLPPGSMFELSHTLTILRQNDVPLHTMHLHLQMDNASSTNKNATVFFFISLHYAETLEDFRVVLQDFLNLGTRPHERIRKAVVLDSQRDWKTHFEYLRLSMQGHTGPKAPRVFEFRQRRGGQVLSDGLTAFC
ncbi:unnamed protein product, partial [Symbiodinium sp. KB8]